MLTKQQKKAVPRVVPFLRHAAYYFEKGNHYYRQNKLEKAMLFFNKTIELDPENALYHYNLACILSRVGDLEKANTIFLRIINQLDPSLTECYYFMAVNCCMLNELEKARFYLNLYFQFAPDGAIVEEAEDLLIALNGEIASRHDSMPDNGKTEARDKHSPEHEEILRSYSENQSMRRLLWFSLYHQNTLLVEKSIHIFGLLHEGSGEMNLREFVRNPWIKQRMRIQALLELKNLGVKGLVTVYMDGSLRDVDLGYYPLIAPRWLSQWQEVLVLTLEKMRSSNAYGEHFYEDVQAIWVDFINNLYPQVPTIRKKETWAAGLEYALARYHFLHLTKQKLAGQYGVSPPSITARYREINRVLNIEHRAYRNMLRYLTRRGQD